VTITLTIWQWLFAHHHGCVRHDRVVARGLRAEYGEDNTRRRNHVLGALGEYAFALHRGVAWPTDTGPDHHHPDVDGYHVRTTDGIARLILRDCDPDGPYVLVVRIDQFTYRIVGWIDTTTIDRARYTSAPDPRRPPCTVLPVAVLHPSVPQNRGGAPTPSGDPPEGAT
jgi:hypothetical protein